MFDGPSVLLEMTCSFCRESLPSTVGSFQVQKWALYIQLYLGTSEHTSETAVECLLNLESLWFAVIIENFSYSLAEMYVDVVLLVRICRILLKS